MWRPIQAPSGPVTRAFSLRHITGYTTKEKQNAFIILWTHAKLSRVRPGVVAGVSCRCAHCPRLMSLGALRASHVVGRIARVSVVARIARVADKRGVVKSRNDATTFTREGKPCRARSRACIMLAAVALHSSSACPRNTCRLSLFVGPSWSYLDAINFGPV